MLAFPWEDVLVKIGPIVIGVLIDPFGELFGTVWLSTIQ